MRERRPSPFRWGFGVGCGLIAAIAAVPILLCAGVLFLAGWGSSLMPTSVEPAVRTAPSSPPRNAAVRQPAKVDLKEPEELPPLPRTAPILPGEPSEPRKPVEPPDPETAASREFALIRDLLKADRQSAANQRLDELIERWPDTAAAGEARKLRGK